MECPDCTSTSTLSPHKGSLHFKPHNRRVYGSPRLHAELHAEGIACGQKRIARLMREIGLSAQRPKHRTVTTHSRAGASVAAHLLARDFHADRPNQKWTTDTPFIWTQEGWLYLAVVLTCVSFDVITSRSERVLTQWLIIYFCLKKARI